MFDISFFLSGGVQANNSFLLFFLSVQSGPSCPSLCASSYRRQTAFPRCLIDTVSSICLSFFSARDSTCARHEAFLPFYLSAFSPSFYFFLAHTRPTAQKSAWATLFFLTNVHSFTGNFYFVFRLLFKHLDSAVHHLGTEF